MRPLDTLAIHLYPIVMKWNPSWVVAALLLAGTVSAPAEFTPWSSKDGRTVELDLVRVLEENGEKVGLFRTREGRDFRLKASQLSAADAQRLDEAPVVGLGAGRPGAAAAGDTASKIGQILAGDLVALERKRLARTTLAKKPKFFVFYNSASWCGPCRQVTPEVVKFYDEKLKDNADYEVFLVSGDRDEDSMCEYMAEDKIQFPALKHGGKAAKEIKQILANNSIPFMAIVSPDGAVVEKGHGATVLQKLKEMAK